jgi:hypothetical protein
MAESLGAEQILKNHPHATRYPIQRAFSGWSRRAGMADCRTKKTNKSNRRLAGNLFRIGHLQGDKNCRTPRA